TDAARRFYAGALGLRAAVKKARVQRSLGGNRDKSAVLAAPAIRSDSRSSALLLRMDAVRGKEAEIHNRSRLQPPSGVVSVRAYAAGRRRLRIYDYHLSGSRQHIIHSPADAAGSRP